MSVMDVIKLRKSVRSYADAPLEDEALGQILEAGRLAPSARNLQEWRFVVVRDKELLTKLVPACKDQKFVGEAGAVIVACSDLTEYQMSCGQLAYPIDLAIAVDHMSLAAAELGVGSCWIGAFYEDKVKELLSIPENVRAAIILVVGRPSTPLDEIEPKPRKALEEIVRYDAWGF